MKSPKKKTAEKNKKTKNKKKKNTPRGAADFKYIDLDVF